MNKFKNFMLGGFVGFIIWLIIYLIFWNIADNSNCSCAYSGVGFLIFFLNPIFIVFSGIFTLKLKGKK